MMVLSGRKFQEKLHRMKSLLLILLPLICFAQESKGFVLDGSYYIGHNCYIEAEDTIGQAPSGGGAIDCFKFNRYNKVDQISTYGDTSFICTYPGKYFISMNFQVSKSNNDANMDDLTIYTVKNRVRENHTASRYQVFRDNSIEGHYYVHNYWSIVSASASDTIKIRFSTSSDSFSFDPVSSSAIAPAMPAVKLQILKISE